LRLGDDHVVVAADVHDHGFIVDISGVRADGIQEMAIVRDDDQHAFVLVQIFLQPMNRIEVEVVGRLVEQQRGRRTEERLRQEHANFLSALKLAHFAFVKIALDAEAVEQRARVGFGGVAALFTDNTFELAETHAVSVGEFLVRLFVECVALLQRLEQLRVDAQRMIERGENPTPEMEQQLDQLLGTIQSKPIYQAAVTSQENFDKIMARVNNWILDGIKRGAASPIITLG